MQFQAHDIRQEWFSCFDEFGSLESLNMDLKDFTS
jgi:hypothetical protein